MHTRIAAELRDIASTLRTAYENGSFALCFAHDRADMASLPATLERLADQAERVPA